LVFFSLSFRSGSKTGGLVHLFIHLKNNAQGVRWLSELTKYFLSRMVLADYLMANWILKVVFVNKLNF